MAVAALFIYRLRLYRLEAWDIYRLSRMLDFILWYLAGGGCLLGFHCAIVVFHADIGVERHFKYSRIHHNCILIVSQLFVGLWYIAGLMWRRVWSGGGGLQYTFECLFFFTFYWCIVIIWPEPNVTFELFLPYIFFIWKRGCCFKIYPLPMRPQTI